MGTLLNNKWIRRVFFLFVSFGILIVIGLLTLVWYRSWMPFFDDGPFFGLPRNKCPEGEPTEIISIYNNLIIKVYDKEENEPAPTVLLQKKDGKIIWCLFAIAYENTKVDKIYFTDYRQFPFKHSRVRGFVEWTYGRESTWWFIDENGVLKGYWYSW